MINYRTTMSNISFSNLVYQLLTIYHIWNERNCRIFQQKGQDIPTVEKLIMEEVRSSAVSWRRIPKTPGNIRICVEWGIPKMGHSKTSGNIRRIPFWWRSRP